jgi:hypothetical protein
MRQTRLFAIALLASTLLILTGCAPHQIYRSDYSVCVSQAPVEECQTNALQEVLLDTSGNESYLMGLVEFDDQGQLWDRKQLDSVITKVNESAANQDILMVVFVHGWKNDAAPGNDNIQTFRYALDRLVRLENRISKASNLQPRKVVGVYLGWRGGSVTMPLLKELTFWNRKNTAHRVGHSGVTEVLSRLELVQKTRDAIVQQDEPDPEQRKFIRSRTRLAVIGHSFGGAVVFSALSQILEERFVDTHGPLGTITGARGFGNLVVLINPAFEAARFATLSDMSTERGTYFPNQLPVLAVLTSEDDLATKLAFPAGRWLSTLFEKEHDVTRKNGLTQKMETIDQGKANTATVGHFKPYQTHYLSAAKDVKRDALTPTSVEADLENLLNLQESWRQDKPGSKINFQGSILERSQTSAGRNPYLVVKVDGRLIADHNDIADLRIISFIRQMILLSSLSDDFMQNKAMLERSLKQ